MFVYNVIVTSWWRHHDPFAIVGECNLYIVVAKQPLYKTSGYVQSQVSYCHESGWLILSLMNHSSHVSLIPDVSHDILWYSFVFGFADIYRLLLHIIINRKEFKNEIQAYFSALTRPDSPHLVPRARGPLGAPCTLIQFSRPKRSVFRAQKVLTNLKSYSRKEQFVQSKHFCRYLLLWSSEFCRKFTHIKKKVQNLSPLLILTLKRNFSRGKN